MSNDNLIWKPIRGSGICGCLLLVIAIPLFVRAQSSTSSRLSFEIASVKPELSRSSGALLNGDAGRFSMTNVKVIGLIKMAYGVNDFQISSGPVWINSERFDPIYRLRVVKGGSKLIEVSPPSASQGSVTAPPRPGKPTPRPGGYFLLADAKGHLTFTMKAATIDNLVGVLSQQLGRRVIDETGLTGTYDADLQWTSSLAVQEADEIETNSGDISIATALQEQLGLKLVSTTGPVETIVVHHIEEPSPN